ncbi:MAG: PGRS family protein [Polyangiaceae bacterium]
MITEAFGVFVANDGDDEAAGTREAPVKSLQKAVDLADAQHKRVYACSQTFVGAIEVPSGIALHGGFDCTGDWSWQAAKPTVIAGAAGNVPVRLLGGAGKTRLVDLRVEAADAVEPGGSSIAVIAESGEVEIQRSRLEAGAGMAGSDGEPHAGAAATGPDGNPGQDDACSGGLPGPVAGAASVSNPMCPMSAGGKGGTSASSIVVLGGDFAAGLPGGAGQPMGGAGGVGATGTYLSLLGGADEGCTSGSPGASGDEGSDYQGATGRGLLTKDGWLGVNGGNGGSGTFGLGGGGGGGGYGCGSNGNNSGGSGAAGGCGGLGANGGLAGGASIALVTLDAKVTLDASTLVADAAGQGGAGGEAQEGGLGGKGGKGVGSESTQLNVSWASCSGGKGGAGGKGGGAGGGAGGHSLAVAYLGAPPTQLDMVTFAIGTAGAGGPGSAGTTAAAGGAGMAAETLEFFLPE